VDLNTGPFLGVFIGIISGTVALLLLKTADTASIKSLPSLLTLTVKLLAIPAFAIGGTWMVKSIPNLNWDKISDHYIISLSITFVVIVSFPISRWIVRVGRELGQGPG
jgi:hypothetical protein